MLLNITNTIRLSFHNQDESACHNGIDTKNEEQSLKNNDSSFCGYSFENNHDEVNTLESISNEEDKDQLKLFNNGRHISKTNTSEKCSIGCQSESLEDATDNVDILKEKIQSLEQIIAKQNQEINALKLGRNKMKDKIMNQEAETDILTTMLLEVIETVVDQDSELKNGSKSRHAVIGRSSQPGLHEAAGPACPLESSITTDETGKTLRSSRSKSDSFVSATDGLVRVRRKDRQKHKSKIQDVPEDQCVFVVASKQNIGEPGIDEIMDKKMQIPEKGTTRENRNSGQEGITGRNVSKETEYAASPGSVKNENSSEHNVQLRNKCTNDVPDVGTPIISPANSICKASIECKVSTPYVDPKKPSIKRDISIERTQCIDGQVCMSPGISNKECFISPYWSGCINSCVCMKMDCVDCADGFCCNDRNISTNPEICSNEYDTCTDIIGCTSFESCGNPSTSTLEGIAEALHCIADLDCKGTESCINSQVCNYPVASTEDCITCPYEEVCTGVIGCDDLKTEDSSCQKYDYNNPLTSGILKGFLNLTGPELYSSNCNWP